MATRLKVPQWKILHYVYPTNILLQKKKKNRIKETKRGTACNFGDIHFIEHLLLQSAKIHSVWRLEQNEIFKRTGKKITITEALLGCTTSTKDPTINHKITLVKKMYK